jgi:hypothetical protein
VNLGFFAKRPASPPLQLAQRLQVTPQTIVGWEAAAVLRLQNDLTARMIIASVLFDETFCVYTPKLYDSVEWRRAEDSEITIRWDASARCWEQLSRPDADDEQIRRRSDQDEPIRPTANRYRLNQSANFHLNRYQGRQQNELQQV